MFISPPPASTKKCTCPPKSGWGNEAVHDTTFASCPINGPRKFKVKLTPSPHSGDWIYGLDRIRIAEDVHPIFSPERERTAVIALLHSIPVRSPAGTDVPTDLADFLEGVAEGLRRIRKDKARDHTNSPNDSAGDGGIDRP